MAKKKVPLQVKKPTVTDTEAFVAGKKESEKKPSADTRNVSRLTIYLPKPLIKLIKLAAIEQETSASAIVEAALEKYVNAEI